MKRIDSTAKSRARQRGVSVITAVFLLLLMAMLAAAMVSIVSTSHVNMAADIGGSRAYQAARGGVEWGMYQLEYQLETGVPSASLPNCVNGTPAIPEHSVQVNCSRSTYTEAGRNIGIYRIVSVATANAARAPGIERRVEATLEICRASAAPYAC